MFFLCRDEHNARLLIRDIIAIACVIVVDLADYYSREAETLEGALVCEARLTSDSVVVIRPMTAGGTREPSCLLSTMIASAKRRREGNE